MKRYDSYKDSGIEWIGEIPSHWDCKRLKQLVESPLKYGANEAAESDDPSQPRYIRITDFGQNGVLREDTFKSLPENLAREYLLEEGDILLARSGATVGKTFLFQNYKGKACFAGYLIRCRFSKNRVDSRFINYYTFSNFYENWKQSIFQQATIQNIGADKYNQLLITTPPHSEQTLIANYLDHKTKQLDDLIAKKEHLIELLEEERIAIINQAVTKGLDPTVPMKDSGIDWLGEIPTHWEVGKIKNFSKIISKGTTPSTVGREIIDNGNIRYIKSENIIDNNLSQIPEFYIDDETNEILKRSKLEINDVLIVIAGASIGKVAILSEEFYPSNTNQAVSFIRLNNPNSSLFLWYWLQTSYVKEKIQLDATQAAQPNISMENIGNLSFPKISQKEENEITTFLKIKTLEIDTIISKTLQEIEFLKEYKTALISEVVTGKVDVRYEKLN